MKRRILITGGSGLLAVNWAMLRREDCEVILCQHNRIIELEGVVNTYCDLSSVEVVIEAMLHYKPDIVIHTAGLTNIEQCEKNPELAEFVNVVLASNVSEACFQQQIPLVHISTDHLFSGKGEYLSENTPVSPVNVYGRTKAMAEEVVLSNYSKALIVRTNFYGWGTSYRQSFSDYIIKNLRAGKIINLFTDVLYSPIVISRLVDVVHELVRLNQYGIFHIVGDKSITKYDFGKSVATLFGLNVRLVQPCLIVQCKNLVKRPLNMSLSNDKVCALLGERMGDVDNHLAILSNQEKAGDAAELGRL